MTNQIPTGSATATLTTGTPNTAYLLDESTLIQGFSDPDHDTLSVAGLLADSGEISKLTGGQWRFTPDSNFSGTVSFDYLVVDGKGGEVQGALNLAIPATQSVAGFNISPTGIQSTGEDGTTANYSISLNTAPLVNQNVVLTFASSDTSEGVINTPTLTFTSINYATPQTLTVQGVDDYLDDGAIPYQVTTKVSTLDIFYKVLAINPFNLSNSDDGLDVALDLYGDQGGSKSDVMSGGTGADKLHGKDLADNLSGGLGNDSLWGGYGDDNLFGEDGDDRLEGEQENDYMDGGAGNDFLYGTGGGLDTMIGGAGNDTYYLDYDGLKDVIDDQGLPTDSDTVIMPFQITSYTLPTGIENGTISEGSQTSNLTGNDSNNALTGNDGKNMLVGAVGRDSLFGGSGNDVLNGGTDDDVLEGGTGKDNLTGGAGKDSFLFDAALKANVDKITDFNVADDTIQLENQIFTKLAATGVLNADNFVTTAAHDTNDYLIYNKATGALSYDADGSGAGVGIQIAMIGLNLALTAADFVVI